MYKLHHIDFYDRLFKDVSLIEANSEEELKKIVELEKNSKHFSLTLEEAEILSNSLLFLIKNTMEAKEKLKDAVITGKLEERLSMYRRLNYRICDFYNKHNEYIEN